MIDIIPYEPIHLTQIKLKDIFSGECVHTIKDEAVTLLYRGEPIAIFGWPVIHPGVACIWGLVSELVRECPIAFHKACLNILSNLFKELKLHRLHMTVKDGYSEGMDWAEAIGFQYEGTMKKYGPDGSDYCIFARYA